MFLEKMIAPCGLNCSICREALRNENPCPGCNVTSEWKSEYCATLCPINFCDKRKNLNDRFCDTCKEYPCQHIISLENRYTTAYPAKESPMQNINSIRTIGMDKFLNQDFSNWQCKDCDGIICVHSGTCNKCGKQHSCCD